MCVEMRKMSNLKFEIKINKVKISVKKGRRQCDELKEISREKIQFNYSNIKYLRIH